MKENDEGIRFHTLPRGCIMVAEFRRGGGFAPDGSAGQGWCRRWRPGGRAWLQGEGAAAAGQEATGRPVGGRRRSGGGARAQAARGAGRCS
jgi:hypothetical protein